MRTAALPLTPPSTPSGFDARVQWAEEADEEQRRARRERKLEKKKASKEAAAPAADDGGMDPEMAALMGFGGFAGGKGR